MKNLKKLLAVVLTFVMVFSMTTIVFAEENGDFDFAEFERFNSVTGTIVEINDDRITVLTDTGEVVFETWLYTYVIGELAVGEEITGFIRPGIMTLQWPPHYRIDVIVVGELESEIAVARFELVDDHYVSLCRHYQFSPEGLET